MITFKKKPVEIQALRWDETKETFELLRGAGLEYGGYASHATENFVRNLSIRTLEGSMRAEKGDWIVKGVEGEFYPIKDSVFRATYLAVDTDGALALRTPERDADTC